MPEPIIDFHLRGNEYDSLAYPPISTLPNLKPALLPCRVDPFAYAIFVPPFLSKEWRALPFSGRFVQAADYALYPSIHDADPHTISPCYSALTIRL